MKVQVRGPRFYVKIVPLESSVPDALLQGSVRHIRISRQMGASGAFQITLLPRARVSESILQPSWLARIQPMSYVEISLWVPPRPKQIVMRGFVDTVAESFSIEGGTPSRSIIIAGRDYGKLTLITRLFYLDLPKIPQEFELFRQWQIGFDSLGTGGRARNQTSAAKRTDTTEQTPGTEHPGVVTPAGRVEARYLWTAPEILGVIFERFFEPQFNLLRDKFFGEKPASPSMSLTQDALDEEMKTFSPQFALRATWQPYTDIWTLLRTYANAPWRELFWEDDHAGPVLVSRPTPWMKEDRSYISPIAAVFTKRFPITGTDIMSMSLARTDEEARNFFFTYPGIFGAFAASAKTIGAAYEGMMGKGELFQDNPVLTRERNVTNFRVGGDYKIFGLRMAEYPSQYFDYDGNVVKDEVGKNWKNIREIGKNATRRLVDAYGHGAALENGSITLKGNEDIRLGCYLDVAAREPFHVYVERVQHDFTQGSGTEGRFVTTVGVTRGNRQLVKRGAQVLDLEVSVEIEKK
jgi:hypothetical protein